MAVLGAGLAREEDQLLGAIAVSVDIHHQFEAGLFKFAQAQLGHFDILALFRSDDNPSLRQHSGSAFLGQLHLTTRDHRSNSFPGHEIARFLRE